MMVPVPCRHARECADFRAMDDSVKVEQMGGTGDRAVGPRGADLQSWWTVADWVVPLWKVLTCIVHDHAAPILYDWERGQPRWREAPPQSLHTLALRLTTDHTSCPAPGDEETCARRWRSCWPCCLARRGRHRARPAGRRSPAASAAPDPRLAAARASCRCRTAAAPAPHRRRRRRRR